MLTLQSQSRTLASTLNLASLCVSKKNTLAILGNVLLSCVDDKFFFTTATIDSNLTLEAPVTLISGHLDTPVALPIDRIVSFLSSLPDCVVTITINDNQSVVLDYCIGSDDNTKAGQASIPYCDGSDFPTFPWSPTSEVSSLSISGSKFARSIAHAGVFANDDGLRPAMCSLCIDVSDDASECYLVSTNGHILTKVTAVSSDFSYSGSIRCFIIPRQFFRSLLAFKSSPRVQIDSIGSALHVSSDGVEFFCKTIESKYVNYDKVIPRDNPYFVVVDKKEMTETIKRISILGDKTSPMIKLRKEGMFLTMSACNVDFSTNSSEQVFISNSDCVDGFEIGANPTWVIAILQAIDADTIRIEFSDPCRPIVAIADVPSPCQLTLAMPMLIQ